VSRSIDEALLELDAVTRRLRRECPWDREQDERSIVPHTIEEAYELADAAHDHDYRSMLDELGDVLFQVYFLALLLEERGEGDLATVASSCVTKLVRRHPHVFESDADSMASLPTDAQTPAQVRQNWDEIKRSETGRAGNPFGDIPTNLPSLLYARKVLKRSGRVAATSKTESQHGSADAYEQVGDELLALVERAHELEVDPEIALRRSADRLRERASERG
jgi:XTP/dITP diphosphohydrolase/tetrapyrrole methylase family protein/MazG family protein/ATP diphosphatase